MITFALLGIAAAMMLVRVGWSGRRVAAPLGWALAVAALASLTFLHGAWGLAVGMLAGVSVAMAMVLHAGWVSPARSLGAARQVPSIALPRHPSDLARRASVFVLVVPCAFAAAQWLAFGVQAIARRGGAVEVNVIVLALFVQPIAWGVIVAVQMTRSRPTQMIAPPVVAALIGTALWSAS